MTMIASRTLTLLAVCALASMTFACGEDSTTDGLSASQRMGGDGDGDSGDGDSGDGDGDGDSGDGASSGTAGGPGGDGDGSAGGDGDGDGDRGTGGTDAAAECGTADDCTLLPASICCEWCGEPALRDFQAVPNDAVARLSDPAQCAAVSCLACIGSPNTRFVADCDAGQCVVAEGRSR